MLLPILLLWSSIPGIALALGGEKAFFTTKQMSSGVSHRQDICERYALFQNGTVGLKEALDGLQLNVLMGNYQGAFFNYDHENGINSGYPGISAVLMDELAFRAGFSWRESFGVFTDPAGPEFNETWTDVLTWGIDTYDINVDWWSKNFDRVNMGVAFLEEWYDSSIIMIGKEGVADATNEEIQTDFWNWTKPFDSGVWWVTIATIFITAVVFQWLEWLVDERGDRGFWVWVSDNIYLSAMNSTQAYEYGTPKSGPSKIVGFSMALWALILTATYTANLATLLIDRSPADFVITTIEEAAVFGKVICTWEGTHADSYVEKAHPKANRRPKKSSKEIYDALNDGECDVAAETKQSWLGYKGIKEYNSNCELGWMGDERVVSTNGAGFAVKADVGYKCTSLIRDVIDFHLEMMIADGIIEEAWEEENKQKQDIDCQLQQEASNGRRRLTGERGRHQLRNEGARRRKLKAGTKAAAAVGTFDESESEQMTLNQMIGTFTFHWGLMGIALVIALMKTFYRKKFGRAKSKKFEDQPTETPQEMSDAPTTSDLQRQIQVLNHLLSQSQMSMNEYQQRMMTEQQEMRQKIDSFMAIVACEGIVPENATKKEGIVSYFFPKKAM